MILNCPVTVEDVIRANKIYVRDIHSLKGKTTRTQPTQLVTDYVKIPPSVLENNKHVTLSIDIMYVTRIPFVNTISCNIKFITVKAIEKRTKSQLVQSIKNVLPIYTQLGLQVDNAILDGEFVPLCTDLLTLGINPNFDRQHRGIKEHARACRHSLPFKVLPRLMLLEMVNLLRTMAQHVPTKRRNRISDSKNLDNEDKVRLQETLSITFWVLRAGTRRTNPHYFTSSPYHRSNYTGTYR